MQPEEVHRELRKMGAGRLLQVVLEILLCHTRTCRCLGVQVVVGYVVVPPPPLGPRDSPRAKYESCVLTYRGSLTV